MRLRRLFMDNPSPSFEERIATKLQFSALCFLQKNQGASMGELSEHLMLSMPGSTQLVERLVKTGAVERGQNSNDRRKICLSVTPEGEQQLQCFRDEMLKKIGKLLNKLSKSEIDSLENIISKILH